MKMHKIQKTSTIINTFKHLPWRNIFFVLLIVLFFSFSVILTYDSGHYLGYVSIFEGNSPASSWDIVRGPVFPLIIQASNLLFGKTSTGILVCIFLFYLVFMIICYKICKDLAQSYKHPIIIHITLFIITTLNPLIFGYYHVLLTEFVAITITMLTILMSLKWLQADYSNKKSNILYTLFFILINIFCWHLKQPYILIAIIPPILATILSIINNHNRKNILYRLTTIILSTVFVIISIFTWNLILKKIGTNTETGRDSSSMLGKQLLYTYQIPFNVNDNISTKESIFKLTDAFFKNPIHITKTYLKNYCGLTSVCEVFSENSVDYIATSNIQLLNTYENTTIGYATFNRTENMFSMEDHMRQRALSYYTPVSKNIFTPIEKFFEIPTNILFKLATTLSFPCFIVLIIYRVKYRNKHSNEHLFILSFMLIGTSAIFLVISSVALVIDRYAIEIFTPALLGIFGTISYIVNTKKNNKR